MQLQKETLAQGVGVFKARSITVIIKREWIKSLIPNTALPALGQEALVDFNAHRMRWLTAV
jgi:hypothetical protein